MRGNKEIPISLNSIETVKAFVSGINRIDCDMDLLSERRRFIVDAKSVMGIFSLDLSRPVTLVVHSEDPEIIAKVTEVVEKLGRTDR